jgi:hypothetical protein
MFTWLFFTGFTVAGTNDPTAEFKLNRHQTQYRTITVQNLEIFYREAGSRSAPVMLEFTEICIPG